MKHTFATVIVLLACLSVIGQGTPTEAQSQPSVNARDEPSHAVSPAEEIPRFHSDARQVLLGVTVLKPEPDKSKPDESLLPRRALKRYPIGIANLCIDFAKRLDDSLAASEFHIFDDGTEQHVNYFKKSMASFKDESGVWVFSPTRFGTWGFPPPDVTYGISCPLVKYLIGYVPPAPEPGKCHDVRIVVDGRNVVLDRNRYCEASSDDLDEATRDGTDVGEKMRTFADSEKRGSIKVSANAFSFWSSRVLSLVSQSLAVGSSAPPASDLTYVVHVHDSKAPATVHIAVHFVPPWEYWQPNCPKKEAVYVLGMAYKSNHQLAGQFGATYPCNWNSRPDEKVWRIGTELLLIPTRFDTQMELSPGDYYLRVVVSDGRKRFGIARMPLHVDGFDGQQLAISDVVLSSFPRDASKVLDEAVFVSPELLIPTPLINKDNEFIPDIETRVRHESQFPVYFEIYEPILKQQPTQVYIHVRVTEQKTGFILRDLGLVSAAEWVLPGNPVIPVGFSLNIHKLDPGDYQVEVQASDVAGRRSEWRKAKFTIYE